MSRIKKAIVSLVDQWREEIDLENQEQYEKLNQAHRNEEKRKQFKSIMNFTNDVFKQVELNKENYPSSKYNEHPILDVVRALGRNLQSKHLTQLILDGHDGNIPDVEPANIYFSELESLTREGKRSYDIMKQLEVERVVDLKKDLVLPWSWNYTRYVRSISSIGEGRAWGDWEEDTANHFIILWLPMGIAWVGGGNHSISSGILQGCGTIKARYVYDISPLYNYVYTDGAHYFRKEDDSIICEVRNVEFSGIFEIGRLMKERSISY